MPSPLNLTTRISKTPRFSFIASRTPLLPRTMATQVNSETLSKITEKEKEITGEDGPVKGGPTAQAQKHVGEDLTSGVISDITKGEKEITGGERVKGGPTSVAQSMASIAGVRVNQDSGSSTSTTSASGILDSATISKITEKEKGITGLDSPVDGGPTAQAQKHVNERITSEVLSDITVGEKKITGGERVKGGPTSVAQSELGKAKNEGNA